MVHITVTEGLDARGNHAAYFPTRMDWVFAFLIFVVFFFFIDFSFAFVTHSFPVKKYLASFFPLPRVRAVHDYSSISILLFLFSLSIFLFYQVSFLWFVFSPSLGLFLFWFFSGGYFLRFGKLIFLLLSSVGPYRERENGSSPAWSGGRGSKVRFLDESEAKWERGGGIRGTRIPPRLFPKILCRRCPKTKEVNFSCPWADGLFLVSATFFLCACFWRQGRGDWAEGIRVTII